MVQEQRRTKDPVARKQILVDFQRYAAEQQYYVYLFSTMITSSWLPPSPAIAAVRPVVAKT